MFLSQLLTSEAGLAAPDTSRLTTGALAGTGVFDILMRTVKLHLTEEFTSERITGQEYSTVYLGAMTAVLQQSVAYLLNHQQEEKIIAEIGLLRQKTVTELAHTDNTIPAGLGFNGDTVLEGLLAAQISLESKKEDLVDKEILKATGETDLVGQKIVTEVAQTSDSLTAVIAAGYGYSVNTAPQGFMKAQQDKIAGEEDLIEQKLVTELAQTSDTKPASLGQEGGSGATTALAGVATAQKGKFTAEIELLSQKSISELAQTADTVPIDTLALNTNTAVTGVLSKQKLLFAKQTDGFDRDAEQKLTKMVLDTWSVGATLGTATASDVNRLDEANTGAIMEKAMAGISVVPIDA